MRHKGPGADTVPMLSYVDRRCDGLDAEVDRRIAGLKEAIEQSRAAMEHRLESMNEWRTQSNDRQRDFPTRDVLDEVAKGLREQDIQQEARLRRLEERITADEGGSRAASGLKAARQNNLATVIAVVTTVLFVASLVVSIVIATRTHGG